jgi:hypothetical protein
MKLKRMAVNSLGSGLAVNGWLLAALRVGCQDRIAKVFEQQSEN